eukprot:184061-Pyramimonas_sp.AAC.1
MAPPHLLPGFSRARHPRQLVNVEAYSVESNPTFDRIMCVFGSGACCQRKWDSRISSTTSA